MVAGDYIGTDMTGTTAIANGTGVEIDSGASANTIGGTTAAAHNVISGNTSDGIYLANDGSDHNLVEGDYIGVDMSGNNSVPNEIGVDVDSDDNTIGGTVAGSGNVISGNNDGSADIGAQIYIPGNDNLVEGNLIGLGADGDIVTVPVGDLNAGVSFQTFGQNFIGSHNTIGGVTAAARNVISGNQSNIILQGGSYNLIEGNYIGTDTTGTIAIGPGPNGTADLIDINTEYPYRTPSAARPPGPGTSSPGPVKPESTSEHGTSESVVEGNYIGTDKTGTLALPNGTGFQEGDEGSPGDNTIGGATSTPGTGAGNLIAGNQGRGISIGQGDGDVVEGNAIGVVALPGGGTSPANSGDGIEVGGTEGAGVQIGGPNAQDQNVISGNTNDGIEINGSSGVLVEGNLIGTDITGKLAVPNAEGVVLDNGSTGNTIGGLTSIPGTGLGNVISGNAQQGVLITGSGTSSNVVEGNIIGLNAAGTSALVNYPYTSDLTTGDGVLIETSASSNTIGGITSSARNVISGNESGIVLLSGATGTYVQADYIGTDLTGMTPIGNAHAGLFSQGISDVIGGATDDGSGNPLPGTAPGNVIAASGQNVDLYGTSDVLAGNLIGLNATGTAPLFPGTGDDVSVAGTNNLVGGMSPNDRNVMTGADIVLGGGGIGLQILNNYIGSDITGTIGLEHIGQSNGIGYADLFVLGASNISIGLPGAGNLIVDSFPAPYRDAFGVLVFSSSGVVIQGNKIGTNAAGTAAIPNNAGIYLAGCDDFLIGGTAPGAGNLISGNLDSAIAIDTTTGGTIEGNLIGTDVTGMLAIPNDGYFAPGGGSGPAGGVGPGAVILGNGASDITIGGTTAAARNVISGTYGAGILVSGYPLFYGGSIRPVNYDGVTQDNTIEGNYIGLNAGGNRPLPNTGTGIDVTASALNTTIGGTATGAANVISGNAGNGVLIDGTGPPSVTTLYLKADGNATNFALSGDAVGNGALVGSVSYGPGVTGQAFQIHDTPGERVVVPGGTAYLDQTGLTLSAWINLNSLPGATPYVIASQAYSSTSETYGLYVSSGGQLVFEWYSQGTFHTLTSTSANLGSRLGTFQQVAVTTDDSTVTFYVNGVAVGSSAMPVPLDITATGDLDIGGLANGPNLFDGLIDDLSFTISPLPADVIAQIYANAGQGTDLGGSGTQDTTVAGNFIGTNPAGTSAIANGGNGVEINDAFNNTIGANAIGTLNVISGNTGSGVEITGAHATGNTVEGDYLGTDITGTVEIANATGVEIDTGASGNTIGGLTATPGIGAGNVISGNTGDGVDLSGNGTSANVIEGDLIGTDVTGTVAIANGTGVELDTGAFGNTIGATAAGAGNTIADNTATACRSSAPARPAMPSAAIRSSATASSASSSARAACPRPTSSADRRAGRTTTRTTLSSRS